MQKKLVLASTSPRRKTLLSSLGIPFETASPPFDEEAVPFEGDPFAHAMKLAEGKAHSVSSDGIVLAADTLVYCAGRLFPKPGTVERAKTILSDLVGKTHTVYTAVCALMEVRLPQKCGKQRWNSTLLLQSRSLTMSGRSTLPTRREGIRSKGQED